MSCKHKWKETNDYPGGKIYWRCELCKQETDDCFEPDDFEKIIERLRAAHLRWPSLRFLQLICNIARYDQYYIEDVDFLRYITEHMEDMP